MTFVAAFPTLARGTLLSVDDPVFGPGALTRDTDTELDWLDITFTVWRSYDDVSTQLGADGDYPGFRYASVAEVRTLFEHAEIPVIGLPENGCIASTLNVAAVEALIALVGAEQFADGHPETAPVTGQAGSGSSHVRGDLDFLYLNGIPG